MEKKGQFLDPEAHFFSHRNVMLPIRGIFLTWSGGFSEEIPVKFRYKRAREDEKRISHTESLFGDGRLPLPLTFPPLVRTGGAE